jgi:TIGR03009 family protein
MRIFTYAALTLMFLTLLASAQSQPAQPENVDAVLRGWEKAMIDLQSFACEARRTTTDKTFNTVDEFRGYAMFMKPLVKGDTPRARLQLHNVKNTETFEKVIITGPFLYQYSPGTKTVYVHDMPAGGKGAIDQESFLSFLFGMGAEQAKSRYDMKLVYPSSGKPDPNYHYIQVVPRTDKDKTDFAFARLSLLRSNNLPAQVWYLQNNKNEIEWSFTKIQTNVAIPADKYFVYEEVPGWRTERGKKAEVGPGPKKIGSK